MQRPDRIDELASALLDDSSMEQSVASAEPQYSLAAMVQANLTAFSSNHMLTSPASRIPAQKLLDVDMTGARPGRVNRRSVTGPLNQKPTEDNIVRRSKTVHHSRKAGLAKQKSVLKKMTGALTDRLHLTLKNADSGSHGDTTKGDGIEQMFTGLTYTDQTQVRKQSMPNREVKNESPKKKAEPQPVVKGSRNCRSPRRSMSLTGDPFIVKDCGTELPNDFLVRLRASSTTEAGWCTPTRSTTESLVSLMKGQLGSLGRGNPTATSSPRVQITLSPAKTSSQAEQCEASVVTSVSPFPTECSLISETSNEKVVQELDNEEEKTQEAVGNNNASPVCGYRYPTGGPVAAARASDRKKHPSPSKDDLAILAYKFTVLRESKREEAQRQASPLSNSPGMHRHRTESEVLNRYIVERLGNEEQHAEEDDLDELAVDCMLASLAKPTVNKRRAIAVTGPTVPRLAPPVESRQRAPSIQQGCYSPATLPDCACPGNNRVNLETDCPLHGGMAEVNELQWTDSNYDFVPRHVC
ncbi:hypothetical protein DL546_007562 [Coniochaeta pulveracea]|uniref:Uncharacterized protein n=1 Tax=Coniochaeta pulveracea TaxID=177199 RepID=A0A420YCZ0_9PEZI|nr:hypothetical protein DL546_007562 [Coniochaeta pulveracea]